jgi:hypothetical protein
MSWYPQIGAGTITQFPFQRSRTWRVITNQLESGELVSLPDPYAGQIAWDLTYSDLSDSEVTALSNLFTASHGSFGAFAFIDPLANLLGWSEDLSQANWQFGLLGKTNGVTDPLGTPRAWAVTNASPGQQQLSQTLGVPGDYVACFSAYVRADAVGAVTIQRDGMQILAAVGPQWRRIYVSGTGTSGAAQSTFGLVVGAGQTLDVWGMQVEVQPYPSLYRTTTSALGIYEETYFANDELIITSKDVGLSGSTIRLVSRV